MKPVNFTAKGDREVVAQLFFKLVYSITGEANAQPRSPRRGLRGWLSGLDIKFGRKHAGRSRSVREVSSFDDGEPLALTMRDSTIRDLKRKESQLKRESTFASRESTRL